MNKQNTHIRKKRKVSHNSGDGEVIQFGNRFLVRFGPFLHYFVLKNGMIYRKGCVFHQLFAANSLTKIVKQLRDNIFIENDIFCIGSTYLAPLSVGLKNRIRFPDPKDKQKEKGFVISDGVLKSSRIDRQDFNPYIDNRIETNNSPIVIIDAKGEAYKTDRKGYVVVKYFPNKCDTVVIDLNADNKIIAATIDECDPIDKTVTLGSSGMKRKLKGHLLMISALDLESEPFQVLFVGDGGVAPTVRRSDTSKVKPVVFCPLEEFGVIQFASKVYLLGSKQSDNKPVALVRLSPNGPQSTSFLHIRDLVVESCGEQKNELIIGNKSESCESNTFTQDSNLIAFLCYEKKKFLFSIKELIDGILGRELRELRPKYICFGGIAYESSVVNINADGMIEKFEFQPIDSYSSKFVECGQRLGDESRSRAEIMMRMIRTDRTDVKSKFPIALDMKRHTIWLNRGATLFVRQSMSDTVVKVKTNGFAIVSGYLIVVSLEGGLVCAPDAPKLIHVDGGHHFLQCGKCGHILFLSRNSLLVFNALQKASDPIDHYFKKSSEIAFEEDIEDVIEECVEDIVEDIVEDYEQTIIMEIDSDS